MNIRSSGSSKGLHQSTDSTMLVASEILITRSLNPKILEENRLPSALFTCKDLTEMITICCEHGSG